MKKIETGIDHLIELLKEKKELSINDIAKELGVGKLVVEEWIDFLIDEGIVEVEHKLSKDVVRLLEVDEKGIKEKKEELLLHKDSFLSKVDTLLDKLRAESEGLLKAKSRFLEIQRELKEEAGILAKDIAELEKLEHRKREISKEMKASEEEYMKKLEEIENYINKEKEKFSDVLSKICEEEHEIKKEEKESEALIHKLLHIQKTIVILKKQLDIMEKNVATELKESSKKKKELEDLLKYAEKIKNEISLKAKQHLDTLRKKYEEENTRLLKKQEEILKKVKALEHEVDVRTSKSKGMFNDIKKFFEKKMKVEELIDEFEKELKKMEVDLEMIKRKAMLIDAFSKKGGSKKEIEELEHKYNRILEHKKKLEQEMEKLLSAI